jgi:uncharacterized protein YecE (DUF72 family)
MMRPLAPYIGTAGWSLPSNFKARFPQQGANLERYATRFIAAEINSSFYRPHRRTTYERWAAAVPTGFRFAVKVPKTITHQRKLAYCIDLVDPFAEEIDGLGGKLGAVLVQLPPSLALDMTTAGPTFSAMRQAFAAPLICEPRHASWFSADANSFLTEHEVARVAADPPLFDMAGVPGGWPDIAYHRLHGSPRVYYSNYDRTALDGISDAIDTDLAEGRTSWCIFDNTASGAAIGNALDVQARFTPSADRA